MKARSGFTLLEISIVLVIVGLVVGGILVGRDLITSSQIRGTIGQFEKFTAAAITFKTKYGQLPGDLDSEYAATYGFVARSGQDGRGDGDGILEASCHSVDKRKDQNGEVMAFWKDLSDSRLIDFNFDNFNGIWMTMACVSTTMMTGNAGDWWPPVKISEGGNWLVTTDSTYNYFVIIKPLIQPSSATYPLPVRDSVTPANAYALDQKMDDAMPLTGRVTVINPNNFPFGTWDVLETPVAPSATACVSNVGNVYNTSTPDFANVFTCAVRIRFQ